MDYIPTVINAVVVAAVGLLITYVTRAQIDDVRRELRDVKQDIRDVRSEMAGLRTEMRSEFSDVRSEMAALRSDLTQVALAVGARPRPQTG
jgi:uncharacterized protein (DUF3084 family)